MLPIEITLPLAKPKRGEVMGISLSLDTFIAKGLAKPTHHHAVVHHFGFRSSKKLSIHSSKYIAKFLAS